jgi:hypothetical protein
MPDDARSVAFNPSAPASERFDAQAELQRAHRPTNSGLIPSADIMPIIRFIENQQADAAMMKASGQVIQFPGRMNNPPRDGMRSVYLDEQQIYQSGDYYEKPCDLDFDGLRNLVRATPILSAVVMTRVRQVSRFCSPSEDGGMGFEIRHQDRKTKLEGDEAEGAKLLTRFIQNCGMEFDPRRRKAMRRDNFTQFMAKSVADSLSMDASPIETEMKRNRALGIDGFYAPDGATIRLCTEQGYEGDDAIYAIQLVQGRIACSYTYEQLIYEVRNPQTEVVRAGYGMGEPELMIRVITGILNAMQYNIAGFDQNAIPKGLLHLTGDYSEEDLVAFRRYWNMMVKGINNAWSLPVMVSKDEQSKASFERFGIEFSEMAFSKWMTFLTSIVCAIYGMAPDEVNFESFAAQKSGLSGSDTEEKLSESHDKGLRPLLSFYEATISDFIISGFDPRLCFRWVGLDEQDPKQKWEEDKLCLTVDELRLRRGDPPFPVPALGSAPLNPSLMAAWQASQQPPPQQQPDYGQGGGDEGFGRAAKPQGDGVGGGDEPGGDAGGENGDSGEDAQDNPGAGPGAEQPPQQDFGKALSEAAVIWSVGAPG